MTGIEREEVRGAAREGGAHRALGVLRIRGPGPRRRRKGLFVHFIDGFPQVAELLFRASGRGKKTRPEAGRGPRRSAGFRPAH